MEHATASLEHLSRAAFSLIALEAEAEVRHRDRIDGIDAQIAVLKARRASHVADSVKVTASLGERLRKAGVAPGERVAIDGHVFQVTNAACLLVGPDVPADDEDDQDDDTGELAERRHEYAEMVRVG